MVNLDDFKYGGTNVTAFRLLDPDRDEVKQVVQDWIFGEMRYGRKMEAHEQTIKVFNLHCSTFFKIFQKRKFSGFTSKGFELSTTFFSLLYYS